MLNLRFSIKHLFAIFLLLVSSFVTAQSKNYPVQPIYFVETSSNLGIIAEDANGNPLTASKNFNYHLFISYKSKKPLEVVSIQINQKKVSFLADSFLSKPIIVGINPISNDTLIVQKTKKHPIIRQFEIQDLLLANKKLQNRVVITVKQQNNIRKFTFFIPLTIVESIVNYQ